MTKGLRRTNALKKTEKTVCTFKQVQTAKVFYVSYWLYVMKVKEWSEQRISGMIVYFISSFFVLVLLSLVHHGASTSVLAIMDNSLVWTFYGRPQELLLHAGLGA